ncbi:MAG: polysaccharide export protein [Gammaproteobacteria bacterium]|nr:polysaccharide export protein [Gammaproteobacteria bacterium]MBT8150745.1 polysaccharide export protein [Gammaproteobacteria bacterium]NND38877.1 polysaccharide export protein [Pseudomonadales bacterium]NNL11711.1 polysaccharide export protein [Pseudomonadales bacterium]NNM11359.1 polysaccharide export protein [Pseudomonadales bacterium]
MFQRHASRKVLKGNAFINNFSRTARAAAFALLVAMVGYPGSALVQAQEASAAEAQVLVGGSYNINAGDVLSLSVWNEPTLSAEQILVRPDGFISVPVIGEIQAGGSSIAEVQQAVADGLGRYLKDKPSVVIDVLATNGSNIYVLGKVARPGAYPLRGPMDVTQALALGGGLNSFAAENKILVLRRDAAGGQRAIKFKYGKVKDGDRLGSNIVLQSGDVVLVP